MGEPWQWACALASMALSAAAIPGWWRKAFPPTRAELDFSRRPRQPRWRTLAGTVNHGEVTCYSPACGAAPGRLHGEACEEERPA